MRLFSHVLNSHWLERSRNVTDEPLIHKRFNFQSLNLFPDNAKLREGYELLNTYVYTVSELLEEIKSQKVR